MKERYNHQQGLGEGTGTKAVGALHDANTPTANRPKPTNLFIINLFMSMNNL